MAANAMILQKHTAMRKGRVHDGKVMVMRSNLRWCSDGLEFTCWNGEVIRVAFIIDAFDREIISWVAVANAGISGSDVRGMMLEAFVKTLKRDYIRILPLPDAETVLRQIHGWIEDYNEIHPHSALRMASPRQFIKALSR